MSVSTDLADAVVDALQNATLSLTPASVERGYLFGYKPTETDLKIFVASGDLLFDMSAGTRSDDVEEIQVGIGIYKTVDPSDRPAVDAMAGYVQEVADLFRKNYRLSGFSDAACVGVAVNPLYDPDILDRQKVFVGAMVLTYRLFS